MGNKEQSRIPQQFALATADSARLQIQDNYIIRQFVTLSPEQHQSLVSQLSRLKQVSHPYLLKLIDSHTIQSHHLCSIITHIYAILERPKISLMEYLQLHRTTSSSILQKAVTSCLKTLCSLKKEGIEIELIRIKHSFVEEDSKGQIIVKFMNPFFEEHDEAPTEEGQLIRELGKLFQTQMDADCESQLKTIINMMVENRISLEQLEQRYAIKYENTRPKTRIKITKNSGVVRKRVERESISSVVSSGSSLMIDGGDESEYVLKDLYQNCNEGIEDMSIDSMDSLLCQQLNIDLDTSHQFPKKYLRNRTFRKTTKTVCSQWSDFKSEDNQNITRDQSLKQNIRMESRALLDSAKLVESFINPL